MIIPKKTISIYILDLQIALTEIVEHVDNFCDFVINILCMKVIARVMLIQFLSRL